MFDVDSLLNFLYIVAFLAAMVLPAFQKQRREEARKRAEEQRRGADVPTVEERDPSDVPEPVVRRKPVPATADVESAAAAESPAQIEHRTASDLPSPVSAAPAHDLVAHAAVGTADFPQLGDAHPISSIGEEIAFGSIGELESPSRTSSSLLSTPSGTGSSTLSSSAQALGTMDREALRRAVLWREVLDKPVSLRQQRVN